MKSWKNRRNTYWIFIATIFGLIFPSNHIGYYKNLIGLFLCWGLYWYCFICNNHEVEKQEQKKEIEKKKYSNILYKKIELKRQNEKQNQLIYIEKKYMEIIRCIFAKYDTNWQGNKISNIKYQLQFLENQRQNSIDLQMKMITLYDSSIKRLKNKGKRYNNKKQLDINKEIENYLSCIATCQKNIISINQDYNLKSKKYYEQLEYYEKQRKQQENKINELLNSIPDEVLKAIEWYLNQNHRTQDISCLLIAKSDVLKKINGETK